MYTIRVRKMAILLLVALPISSMLACDLGGEPAKPTVFITAPTSNARFQEGEEVNILSSATDAKGITRMELLVDGQLYRTDASPSGEAEKALAMVQTWTATDPGMHTLSVIAYNVDDEASEPWAVTVEVVGAGGVVTPPTPTSQGAPPAATNTPAPAVATATAPPPQPTATEPSPEATATAPPPTDTPEPQLPDLVVVGVRTDHRPHWGDSVQFTVGVENQGDAPAGPFGVLFRYGSADSDVCQWDVPYLVTEGQAQSATLTCSVEHLYEKRTVATVDSRHEVEESNEDNNTSSLTFLTLGPPDLYISEVLVDPESPRQGAPATVSVHVHNGGSGEAGAFRVLWISGGSTIGCEWSVDFMAAGADTWYECQYTYAHWAQYTTRAQVDADKAVDESEENNNELDKMVLVRHS